MAPQLPKVLSQIRIIGGPSEIDLLKASFFNRYMGLVFKLSEDPHDKLVLKDLIGRVPIPLAPDEAFLIGFSSRYRYCVIAYNAKTRRGSFCKLTRNLRVEDLARQTSLPFPQDR